METLYLQFPKKSHRKVVRTPNISDDLAEFFGILMGDGGISNPWQTTITLNAIKDKSYSEYISTLVAKLFEVKTKTFKRKTKDALVIQINSISIVDFLIERSFPKGNKLRHGPSIPDWVLDTPGRKRMCVRGLIDTDGCLFIHTHTVVGKRYKNIGLNFSSRSKKLILQVASIFEEFGIIPHISKRGWDIYLYKSSAIARYMEIFGTSNHRISSVYDTWKRGRVVEGARLESV